MTLNLLFIFYTSIKMELTCNNHFQILKTEVIRLKKNSKTEILYQLNLQDESLEMYKILDNVQYCGGWKRVNFFSPKMYEFQFENFKNTKGGSKFFENVYIKTITQTTFKISYFFVLSHANIPVFKSA